MITGDHLTAHVTILCGTEDHFYDLNRFIRTVESIRGKVGAH